MPEGGLNFSFLRSVSLAVYCLCILFLADQSCQYLLRTPAAVFVRGPLLSVVIFSFIWTVDLFRSDMLYIFTVFTWFCPCLQCCFHMVLSMFSVYGYSGYPHFSYRDNDMIFRILDILSNSHAAVVNGRAFEFEPTRIVITSEH